MKRQYVLFLVLFMAGLLKLSAQPIMDWTAYHKMSQINDWTEDDQTIYLATDVGIFLVDKNNYAVVDHWTRTTNGLPSNRVETIGFHPTTQSMYIGTYDIGIGLQAADGHWESMPYPEEVAASGGDVLTYCLEFDAQDRLVVGTNRGALRWDGADWTIFNQETLGLSFFQSVWEMEKMDDGTLVLAGNVPLWSVDDSFELASPLDSMGNPVLFSYGNTRLHTDANGDFLIITDLGDLGRYDGNEWEILSSFNGTSDIAFHNAEFLFEDESGVTWIYLRWEGYAKYEEGEWSMQEEGPLPLVNPHLVTRHENTWLGISTDSLFVYEEDNPVTVTHLSDMPWENTLFRLHKDRQGQLWTRSALNELTALATSETLAVEMGTENLNIYDFLFDQNNDLWVSSGYAFHHFGADGTVETHSSTNSILPDEFISKWAIDGLNRLWVWNYNEGLFVLQEGEWEAVDLPEGSTIELVGRADAAGIYVVSYNNFAGIRLALVTPTTHEWVEFPPSWDDHGFATIGVHPQGGGLWLVNTGNEIAYQTSEGNWELLDFPVEWNSDDYVRKIGFHDNGFWIQGQHRFAFRNLDGQWFYYDQFNLPLDTDRIADTGLDEAGNFWVYHNSGRVVEAFSTSWVTSTEELSQLSNAAWNTVYPNPASSTIYPSWEGWGDAMILDQTGRVIQSYMEVDAQAGISVNDLVAGNYYLLWLGEGPAQAAKFIKL